MKRASDGLGPYWIRHWPPMTIWLRIHIHVTYIHTTELHAFIIEYAQWRWLGGFWNDIIHLVLFFIIP